MVLCRQLANHRMNEGIRTKLGAVNIPGSFLAIGTSTFAGIPSDAHVGITQGSDLKQHNQKDENSHQDGKEREGAANNGVG
jgi:hypothetical protein